MASSMIINSLHISFDSVLGMDDAGLVAVFEYFVATGLKGFLGCPAVYYEDALTEFFENGLLLMEGFTDLSEVLKDLVFDGQSIFSESKEHVSTSCKKMEMKIEFGLLGDILAKTIYAKAGYFDAVTHERFLLMTAITCGVKINWSSLVFDILKDMVTPGSRQAKGYAIQICVLLKNVPGLELGESRAFPLSKILTEKTVHRYVVINEKVGGEEVADAPRVKKTPMKKAASKKRPATDAAAELVVKKKRTTKSKSVSAKETLEILLVAQEAVSLQKIEQTPAAPAEQPPVPKQKSQKRKRSIVGEAAVKVVDDTAEKKVEPVVESVDEPVSLPAVVDVLNEDESSMHFDVTDTTDTSISLPPAATDVMESLAKLRASVDKVQCEQFRRRDDAHNLRDILLVHIRDLEQKISARFDEQDRVHRALRRDMHDHKNLSSLDLKSTHQKLSAQIAAAAFDTVDVRKEVKEINTKVTYLDGQVAEIRSEQLEFRAKTEENYLNLSTQLGLIVDYLKAVMPKRGKVVAAAPNHLLTIKSDPAGEMVAVAIEQMNKEVVLGKVVAEVEVREEVIGVDLPREDFTALVVDRSEDHLNIG
ncbi:delphilin-like [Dorcoceras hygrometricum]|uniref:Delphilin-like n=1 Tax=Dorcoceras hygrometricum TaxID=472368 RepID=A0A2Z7C1H3_9LAMI|nr:delphilin-like [Dorcoceras hygrometricum]